MKNLDNIIDELSAKIKSIGYKKNRLTWYRDKEDITVVFSIQKSLYTPETWYYLFGICLHEIADGNKHSFSQCQITYRITNVMNNVCLSSEDIVKLLERWDSMYGDKKLLRMYAIQGKLPGQYTVKAMRYLTSVNLSNIDFHNL